MRALKVLVAVMGLMLVLGLAVVVGTIIHRATQRQAAAPPAAATFGHSAVALPQGARVVEMRGVGDRLALRVQRADGSEMLIIVDPATGAAIGTIDLTPGS